ncbi:MAG: hypothetical protein M3020_04055, partial [Myxococcota bacterium]|nr:hypothetical protein [Myxococcota bacterium]
ASTPPASPSPSSGGSPAPAASPSPSSASGCAFSPARFDASSLFPLLALALLLLRRRQGSAA